MLPEPMLSRPDRPRASICPHAELRAVSAVTDGEIRTTYIPRRTWKV